MPLCAAQRQIFWDTPPGEGRTSILSSSTGLFFAGVLLCSHVTHEMEEICPSDAALQCHMAPLGFQASIGNGWPVRTVNNGGIQLASSLLLRGNGTCGELILLVGNLWTADDSQLPLHSHSSALLSDN